MEAKSPAIAPDRVPIEATLMLVAVTPGEPVPAGGGQVEPAPTVPAVDAVVPLVGLVAVFDGTEVEVEELPLPQAVAKAVTRTRAATIGTTILRDRTFRAVSPG